MQSDHSFTNEASNLSKRFIHLYALAPSPSLSKVPLLGTAFASFGDSTIDRTTNAVLCHS